MALTCQVEEPSTASLAEVGSYSITSSARASSPDGSLMPSALAVLRLTASSNLVEACVGKSPGPFALQDAVDVIGSTRQLGHQPRIIHAIYVKPFVRGQKNDYMTPSVAPICGATAPGSPLGEAKAKARSMIV